MFRFKPLDLLRNAGLRRIREYLVKRLNRSLEGKVEPLSAEKVSYDLLKGIFVIEDLIISTDFLRKITGVDVRSCKIGSLVIKSNWYNTDSFTEVEISGALLEIDTRECVCTVSEECLRCRKKYKKKVQSIVTGLLEKVLQKVTGRITSRLSTTVKDAKVFGYAATPVNISVKELHIVKEDRMFLVHLEKGNISALGVNVRDLDVKVNQVQNKYVVEIKTEKSSVEIQKVKGEEIEEVIGIAQYIFRKENQLKKHTTPPPGIPEEELLEIHIKTSVKIIGIEELEDCLVQIDNIQINVYPSVVKARILGNIQEAGKSLMSIKSVDFLYSNAKESIEKIDKTIRITAKKIDGNIRPEIATGLYRIYEHVNEIVENINRQENSKPLSLFMTVREVTIGSRIGCTDLLVKVKKGCISVGKEVTLYSKIECRISSDLLESAVPPAVIVVRLAGTYSQRITLDVLDVYAADTVVNSLIMSILAVREVEEYFITNHSRVFDEEKDITKRPSQLALDITRFSFTSVFTDRPCVIKALDISIESSSILMSKIEILCDSTAVCSAVPLQILTSNMVEIICTNGEIAVPGDDMLVAAMKECRTIYMALQKAQTADNSQTGTDQRVKVDLKNTKVGISTEEMNVLVVLPNASFEISEDFKITALNGEIQCRNEILEISSPGLLFKSAEKSVVGNFTCTGAVETDLYVLSVNRAFFILDLYTILTDLPIRGVPTISGLPYLASPEEPEEDISGLNIKIEIDASIYLLRQKHTLCKGVGKVYLNMTKKKLYNGTLSIVNSKIWSDGELISSVPEVTVEFAKVSPHMKSFNILIEKIEASDTIGLFLDIFYSLQKVNFNNNIPSVTMPVEIKCKISQIEMKSEDATITITNFALINSYIQLGFTAEIENKKIFESVQKMTVRTTAYEMQEIHINIEAAESNLLAQPEIDALNRLYHRLNLKRIQKYPIPSDSTIKVECPLVSFMTAQPPVKVEIAQLSLIAMQLRDSSSVTTEGSALCRMFVKVRETKRYEIMCETFPIDITMQTQMAVEKDKTGFCSLPFSDKKEEALLVTFLSFVAKDTIRIRLSKKIVESFKLSEKKVELTNLTNKPIKIDEIVLESMSSTKAHQETSVICTNEGSPMFEHYVPNTKKAAQVSKNIFLATFKEKSAVIRGASNFKNITDTPISVEMQQERIVLPSFSECSNTSILTEFTVKIENNAESSKEVSFCIPAQQFDQPISVVGLSRIEHNESYITVVCLFEVVSNIPILHYLFHHDFVINNLMLEPISFEIKINTKKKVERIIGVAQAGEIKQLSGNMRTEKTKRIRLRINSQADLMLFPYDMTSKVSVSKGVLAVKEAKTVLISGFPVDVGITQVTIYPILIAINKTQDLLYLKSGSSQCKLSPEEQTVVVTSKDKHSLIFGNSESSTFSSKIQYNTIFLDIKSSYVVNYLVNIYQGEGAKEKIKYVVMEYANVVQNKTGLDLTIVTDREFTCGNGEILPLHFPRKKISSWIRLGVPSEDPGLPFASSNSSEVLDYVLDLEKSPGASYLPLEELKKHFVKLNTTAADVNTEGMISSVITSKSELFFKKDQETELDKKEVQKCISNSILLSISIQNHNSQRLILIEKESRWPYLIKNMSHSLMKFSQKGHWIEYVLKPGEVLPYYWDSFKAQAAFNITIDDVTIEVKNFDVVTAGGFKASLTSERNRKILLVTNETEEVRADSLTTQGTLVRIRTGRVSVSLLDREENEFSALHLFNTHLASFVSLNGVEFMLKIDSFQMDNQEVKAYYHIPLHTPIVSDVLTVSAWIVNKSTLRYMSIVMLPVVVEIEEEYMKKVIQHFIPLSEPIENPKYFIMCSVCQAARCRCTYSDPAPSKTAYISIGYVKIEAIKFKCSFRRAPHGSIVPLSSLFCNIKSSKISLPSIELVDKYARTSEIYQIIGRLYKRGFIRNIVSLVLSADIMVNTGELVDKFGVGVHDLIYAPYSALDNPALLSKKLLKGGKSFATNTVTGVTGLVGNLMGKLSHTLADISMDENFAEAIRETSCIYIDELDMGLPGSKTNLSKAGEKFMGSVISGFKGVMHSPIQGKKSNGISGMMQGMGKGLVGAIFKPISGAVGLVQGISTSITGVLSNDKPLLRIQLPRAPPLDGIPTEYEMERSAYYRAYVVLARNDAEALNETFITGGICTKRYIGWYLLITNKRVILYNKEETQELLGVAVAQALEQEKSTLVTIGTLEIFLEGLRVYKDMSKYSRLMIVKSETDSK